ncbi:MAG: hypothetical protein PHO66_05115 [Eubacteriales bacterium]|nr:hypothetical protein [Eubacteriales bacterium]
MRRNDTEGNCGVLPAAVRTLPEQCDADLPAERPADCPVGILLIGGKKMAYKNDRIIDFRYAPDVQQTCISFPYDDYKTVVREDGSLNHLYELGYEVFIDGTEPPCERRILNVQEGNAAWKYRFVPKFYHRDKLVERRQDFGDAGEALVTTIEDYVHSEFSWTTFAHIAENGARMDIMICKLAAKENFGHASDQIYLQCLGDAPLPPEVMPPPLRHHDVLPRAKEWRPAPSVLYTPVIFDGKPVPQPIAYLHAGETWECAFAFVYNGAFSQQDFTLDYAKKALEKTRAFWKNFEVFKIGFNIPDKDLQDMLLASGRNLLQAMEMLEGFARFRVGPTIYRGFWINDTLGLSECAFLMGRDDEAKGGLLETLSHIKPDGSILYIDGLFGETAAAIATIIRHAELEDDDEKVKEYWPTILRGYKKLRELNEESKKLGKDYPGYGLLPPAFGDGGLFGNEAEFSNPGSVITNLTPAWKAGKRLGLPGWEEIKDLCDTMKKNGRDKFDKYLRTTDDGIRYLPASMQHDPRHKPQLHVGAMLPYLDADDDLWDDYFKMLDKVDDAQGIPDNTGWRSDQSLFGYSAMMYARNLIDRGHGEKVVDYIYAFCNQATPSRVWREEQPLTETTCAEACGDMPHNWGSAQLIMTVRRALVNEKPESLEYLAAMADKWLPQEGNDLLLENTPTRFGRVTLRMKKAAEGYELTLERKKGNQQPEEVVLFWKGSAEMDGKALANSGDGRYLLPVEEGTLVIRLK